MPPTLQQRKWVAHPAFTGGKSLVTSSDAGDENHQITARGTPALWDQEIIQTAQRVEDRALSLANQFMGLVLKACDDFRSYSKPKIKELEHEVTAGDLFEGLASIALSLIVGKVAANVTTEIGRAVATKIGEILKDKMSKAANPKSKDLDDLNAAVDGLVSSMGNRALLTSTVTELIGKRCDDIIKTAREGKTLTQDQEVFLGPFMEADSKQVDDALDKYGIPSSKSAKEIYLNVYQGLVQNFEKQLYMSKYTSQDKSIRTSRQLEGEADAMADKAADAEKKRKVEELGTKQ